MSLARQVKLMELERMPVAAARHAARALPPPPAPRQAPTAALALPAPPTAAASALPAPPNKGGAANPPRRLSTEEQAERRRLGLCYNCNEPYSRSHNRVCRRIFYIDDIELDEGAVAEEAPVFSLHAVVGVPGTNTIQLWVTMGTAEFIALIDTGSTHSFIGEDAACRTGLTIEPRPGLTATVANGERIACPGVLRCTPVLIDGLEF
jgi:hypothetical protein